MAETGQPDYFCVHDVEEEAESCLEVDRTENTPAQEPMDDIGLECSQINWRPGEVFDC
jgi:hypothetical protein